MSAQDVAIWQGGPRQLAFSFDRSTGVNGDKLQMTIEVLRVDTTFNAEPFMIVSQLGGTVHTWFSVVAQS